MEFASSFLVAQRLKNLSASLLLIGAVSFFYAAVPYFYQYFSKRTSFAGEAYSWWQVLQATAAGYVALLVLFYLFEPSPRTSKSIYCLRALKRVAAAPRSAWRKGLLAEERLGLLSVLLKAFFAPLMVVSLYVNTAHMFGHGNELLAEWTAGEAGWLVLFNSHGFWLLFKLIIFLDVFFFTLGYLIELPALKNEIRSVDPTLLGWTVALACYPPFNGMTSMIFGGGFSVEFPQFDHPAVHMIANLLLLGLMAIYTWASVALNFKASNLTHRGVIARGPYRYVRHPAYVCKNLAWWIGLMPALAVAVGSSLMDALAMIGSMFGWSIIYYMRALTEEDHLRSVDGEYDAYCQKVKYRFVPGVI